MHCHNCGTEASAQQKFCRSCGMDLQFLLQALTRPQSASETVEDLREVIARFNSRREKMKRWGFITTWVGLLGAASCGVAAGVLASLGSVASNLVASAAGEGGLLALIGIGLMIYSRFLPQVASEDSAPQRMKLQGAATTAKLSPTSQREEVPSITEHTTAILEKLVIRGLGDKRSGDLRA